MPDLTRQEALALARQKWGTEDGVFISRSRDHSEWVICRNFMNARSPMHKGATLRDACRAAGLVEEEQG